MRRRTNPLMRRSLLAYAGIGALLVGLATVVAESAPAGAASKGSNFVATGHDMDLHCGLQKVQDECDYMKIVLQKVRNGSTKPVLALDHGTQVRDAMLEMGLTAPVTVDPDNASALNAVKFRSSSGAPNYSAIVVASAATCGGCDNTPTGEANINARSGDIKKFFNAGGGILALAGADDIATYYDFVPLTGVNPQVVSPPFTVTPEGAALGVTAAMANCCPTHNSFDIPKSPFVTLEKDSAGLAETIAAFNVSIGGGGFTSPPPSSAPPPPPGGDRPPHASDRSFTTLINTPIRTPLVAHDPDGDALHYTVVAKPKHGTLSGAAPDLTYTPDAGFLGHDFYTFTVSDGTKTTIEHVVNIQVVPLGAGTSGPPLANTGTTTRSNLTLGITLLASGIVLLALGLVRRPRRRAH